MKRKFLLLPALLFSALILNAQISVKQTGCSGSNCYTTIQAAVDASTTAGEVITVYPGTYTENVLITKSITLQSNAGPATTIIQGIGPADYVAPIMIQAPLGGSLSNVTIGGSNNKGFTIIGIDNVLAAMEASAIQIGLNNQNPFGPLSNIKISYNTITSAGEAGILTYYNNNTYITNLTIERNTFNGKTYSGLFPAANGGSGFPFNDQNNAKPAIAVNKGASNTNVNNNIITTRVGALLDGNSEVLVNSVGSTISFNDITGHTGGNNGILNVSGSNASIFCNRLDLNDRGIGAYAYFLQNNGTAPYNTLTTAQNNTFLPAGYAYTNPFIFTNSIVTADLGFGTSANTLYPAPNCGGGPLPLKFISLSAAYVSKTLIDVKWNTANETMNGFFNVEQSADGINFSDEANQNSKGNGNFAYNQEIVSRTGGLVFIRIKQTDIDGRSSYSDIVKVNQDGSVNAIQLVQNPVSSAIRLKGITDNTMLKLYSANGTLVMSKQTASFSETMDVSNLSAGLYILKAIGQTGDVSTFKIVKQ